MQPIVRREPPADRRRGECATQEGRSACGKEPDAFAAFGAGFPPKEKLKLPGRLFG